MVFENNELDNYGFSYEMIGIVNQNNDHIHDHKLNDNFYSPKEALIRGNLFKGLFKGYKNYNYRELNPRSEKEMLLLKIQEYDFAISELNLYLDMYANDLDVYKLFKEYIKEYERVKNEYNHKYGPLCVTDDLGNNYDWNKNPWPWDGGNKNV